MKLGISSYCLSYYLFRGEMTIYDVIDWAKEHGADHLELVPFGLPLLTDAGDINVDYVKSIRGHAEKVNIPLSAFSLNACVIKPTEAERREEIARIKKYIDICNMLGIKKMRHDTCSGQHPEGRNTPEQFEEDFPVFVAAIQELADYAASLGMGTTLENHGLYVNGADRMIRLLRAAGRPNIGLTVDVGNYLCVDDNPAAAVAKSIQYADMVHMKDFYVRRYENMLPQQGMYVEGPTKGKPGIPANVEEWKARPLMLGYVGTASKNNILRGAILGQGDMDIPRILEIIKASGYDKEISIEFEGMEERKAATEYCMDTVRYFWDKL